jgi:hypothetical protein
MLVMPAAPLFTDPRRLLLEMARQHALPDLLRLVVDRLAESPRVALARIWLMQSSADWDGCAMPAECRDRSAVDPEVEWTRLDGAFRRFPLGGAEDRADRGHRGTDRYARPAARPARLGRRPDLWHEPFNYQAGGLFCLNSRLVSQSEVK